MLRMPSLTEIKKITQRRKWPLLKAHVVPFFSRNRSIVWFSRSWKSVFSMCKALTSGSCRPCTVNKAKNAWPQEKHQWAPPTSISFLLMGTLPKKDQKTWKLVICRWQFRVRYWTHSDVRNEWRLTNMWRAVLQPLEHLQPRYLPPRCQYTTLSVACPINTPFSCHLFLPLEVAFGAAIQKSADALWRNGSQDLLNSDWLNQIRGADQPKSVTWDQTVPWLTRKQLVEFRENFELFPIQFLKNVIYPR